MAYQGSPVNSGGTRRTRSAIRAGRLRIELHRTLRVPNDGKRYPLPPSMGVFPLFRLRTGEFAVPVHQWEAMWISFDAPAWHPSAVQVSAGGVNVLSGEPFATPLREGNYLVAPPQLWLDGAKTGAGVVRQFVAAPLGQGMTVGEQIAGTAESSLRIRVFAAKPGRFPERGPRGGLEEGLELPFGVAVGGTIEQSVYADPHGLRTWDRSRVREFAVMLLNSAEFEEKTGVTAPPSPVSAADYNDLGLPWFALYDEPAGEIPADTRLAGLEAAPVPGDRPVGRLRVAKIRHPGAGADAGGGRKR